MMDMISFNKYFPEVAEKETRSITLLQGYEGIPPGQYFFLELFCSDPECHCAWAMIMVMGNRGKTCATLRYGWEGFQFYLEWNGDKDWAEDCVGVNLYPLSVQGDYSLKFLKIFKEIIENDKNYSDRIKRHYQMVKEKQQEGLKKNQPPISMKVRKTIGRNELCPCESGLKYKRCCLV